jgi:hypothetical protein
MPCSASSPGPSPSTGPTSPSTRCPGPPGELDARPRGGIAPPTPSRSTRAARAVTRRVRQDQVRAALRVGVRGLPSFVKGGLEALFVNGRFDWPARTSRPTPRCASSRQRSEGRRFEAASSTECERRHFLL